MTFVLPALLGIWALIGLWHWALFVCDGYDALNKLLRVTMWWEFAAAGPFGQQVDDYHHGKGNFR